MNAYSILLPGHLSIGQRVSAGRYPPPPQRDRAEVITLPTLVRGPLWDLGGDGQRLHQKVRPKRRGQNPQGPGPARCLLSHTERPRRKAPPHRRLTGVFVPVFPGGQAAMPGRVLILRTGGISE